MMAPILFTRISGYPVRASMDEIYFMTLPQNDLVFRKWMQEARLNT